MNTQQNSIFTFPKSMLLWPRFQDQLDEYEAERNALLSQNSQAKDEVKFWSCTLLKENIHIFMRFTLVQSKKMTKKKHSDCGSFWPLRTGCLFFFQRKHRGALIAAAIIIFWHALTLCQFQPRGGGDSHMKEAGMLVVSLRSVNFGFCSHLGCSGQKLHWI